MITVQVISSLVISNAFHIFTRPGTQVHKFLTYIHCLAHTVYLDYRPGKVTVGTKKDKKD